VKLVAFLRQNKKVDQLAFFAPTGQLFIFALFKL
jgi:hypothetical protein